MLTLNVSQLLIRLRTADRAVLAMAVVALIAVLFAGNQGLSWWSNYSKAGSLRLEAQQLQTAIANARVGGSNGTVTLAEYEAQLEEATSDISFATNDAVIGLLGDLAREGRVNLVSASVVSAGTRTEGPVTYRLVKLTTRVEGQLSRIYGFIDLVSETTPTASVPVVRLGGFGQAPWATVDIEMLIDPRELAGSAG